MYLYTDMPSHVSQVLDLPLLKALAVAYKDFKKNVPSKAWGFLIFYSAAIFTIEHIDQEAVN